MNNEKLQDARQYWFSEFVENLQLDAPVKEISEKTGYDLSMVSLYLTKKRTLSVKFLQKFCSVYDIDFEALNRLLIEGLKKEILYEQGAGNKTNNPKQKNSKKLSVNQDNLLSSQSTQTDEDMSKLNLELVRHIMKMNEELIATNAVLARKVPDLKDDESERKPLKERRA